MIANLNVPTIKAHGQNDNLHDRAEFLNRLASGFGGIIIIIIIVVHLRRA